MSVTDTHVGVDQGATFTLSFYRSVHMAIFSVHLLLLKVFECLSFGGLLSLN